MKTTVRLYGQLQDDGQLRLVDRKDKVHFHQRRFLSLAEARRFLEVANVGSPHTHYTLGAKER